MVKDISEIDHTGQGMGFGGGLTWLLWIRLILPSLRALQAAVGGGNSVEEPKSTLDILRERNARGAIEQQAFEQQPKGLSG